VSSVAEGDLTVEAEVSDSALGAVADSFNYMITELRQVIGRVNGATQQVSNSTDEILTTHRQSAAGREQQAARIADTSTADRGDGRLHPAGLRERRHLRPGRPRGADRRRGRLAGRDRDSRGDGSYPQQVQETAKKIKRLGESSQEIGQAVH
jgi:twitching motility protein PilJ